MNTWRVSVAAGFAASRVLAARALRRASCWTDVLLPQLCLLCGTGAQAAVCAPCAASLPHLGSHCPVCALPAPHGAVCGECRRTPPAYDRTVGVFGYRFPIDRLVQAYKYRGRLALAAYFGSLLADATSSSTAQLAIPVPLAPRRLRERGFNQALELARRCAGPLGIPVNFRLLVRSRETAAQSALAIAQRHANVRAAFQLTAPVEGRRVAVVDDVMTTGATLGEIARILKAAGAAHVENWIVARAVADRSPSRHTPGQRTPEQRTPEQRTPAQRTPAQCRPEQRAPGQRAKGQRAPEQQAG